MTSGGDKGFAIVAAVGALALFAAVAFAVLAGDQGDSAELGADFAQARLDAAADAGVAMAIDGLTINDTARRWPIDRRPHELEFEGVKLTIAVEDERAKAPLSSMDDIQARHLFEVVGVRGEQIDVLADSLLDWLDDDDEPREHGAEAPQYAALGLRPRNGQPPTVDELARIKGMTPEILARIRPIVTTYFGISGGFDARTASPEAVAVITGGGLDSVAAIERRREADGQVTALAITPEKTLAGRNLTIVVQAADGRGGQLRRRVVVAMTGQPSSTYYVREVN